MEPLRPPSFGAVWEKMTGNLSKRNVNFVEPPRSSTQMVTPDLPDLPSAFLPMPTPL